METIQELQELINNGFITGSRAYGVEGENSDLDICILLDKAPEFITNILNSGINFDIKKYFNVIPKMGNTCLIPKIPFGSDAQSVRVDLIIFDNESNYKDIKIVTDQMKELPKCLIVNKYDRIRIFEIILKDRGWDEKHNIPVGVPVGVEVHIDEDDIPF